MLTRLTVRNFKRFERAEIDLGSPVVFIGPNNSGKTSALQALALWQIGLRRWNEKRSGKKAPEIRRLVTVNRPRVGTTKRRMVIVKRSGVTVNRRDLVAVPIPDANLLWRELHVRDVRRVEGRTRTSNVRIDVIVEGVTGGRSWKCGLEFDYANEESFYCRPLRLAEGRSPERMPVPDEAGSVEIAFLPPMSGLAATETRLDRGATNVRIGEGRTAEVLRNLCYRIHDERPEQWRELAERIRGFFGSELDPPRYIPERGEIVLGYRERGIGLDLSSTGRGLQQTLLLLAYMYANPGAVLLLDEPDAHLEILRQRQIYQMMTRVADEHGAQIIAASHSEVLLNEAADRDLVVAFVGRPHRLGDGRSQVMKALREIGFEQYYQAEQAGWVLYLEGSTDLSMLQAFARRLDHEDAVRALERPFVRYVGNQPAAVRRHYHGLREALPELRGVALFDRLETGSVDVSPAEGLMWTRREIESYVCSHATLESWAAASAGEAAPFVRDEAGKRVSAMREAVEEVETALRSLGRGSPWSPDCKASDDFLTPLFRIWFEKLGLPNLMAKKSFHALVEHVPLPEIDPEIREKLDVIARVAGHPARCTRTAAQGSGWREAGEP